MILETRPVLVDFLQAGSVLASHSVFREADRWVRSKCSLSDALSRVSSAKSTWTTWYRLRRCRSQWRVLHYDRRCYKQPRWSGPNCDSKKAIVRWYTGEVRRLKFELPRDNHWTENRADNNSRFLKDINRDQNWPLKCEDGQFTQTLICC